MSLDPLLIEILVDPEDKQTLWYIEDENMLYNPRLHRGFVIKDGIPVMLLEQAVSLDDEHVARIEARSDQLQKTGQPPVATA